ncbi:hypothetical protein D043_2338, partial [Vibrio parahaemolyticus EKP-021]
QLMQNNV